MDESVMKTLTAASLALSRLLTSKRTDAAKAVVTLNLTEAAAVAGAAADLESLAQRHYMALHAQGDEEVGPWPPQAEDDRDEAPSPSPASPEPPAGPTEARAWEIAQAVAREVVERVKEEVRKADLAPEAMQALVEALERAASAPRPAGATVYHLESRTWPLGVECPVCEAPEGAPCTDRLGDLAPTHRARREAADSRPGVGLLPRSPEEVAAMIESCRDQLPEFPADAPQADADGQLLRPTITEISPDIREHHPELADALERAKGDADVFFGALPPDSPFVVGCAYCMMPIGEPCRDITAGIIVPVHRERREKAYKLHHAVKQGELDPAHGRWQAEYDRWEEAQAQKRELEFTVETHPIPPGVKRALEAEAEDPTPGERAEALEAFDAEHPPKEPTPLPTGVDGLRDFIERTGVDPEGYEAHDYQRAFYDELQSGDPTGQAAVNQADSEEAFLARERADAEPLRRAMARGLGMQKVQFHDPGACSSTAFAQDGMTGVFWCSACSLPVRPKDDPIGQQDAAEGAPE